MLKAKVSNSELRSMVGSFCPYAENCPSISPRECGRCLRFIVNLEEETKK